MTRLTGKKPSVAIKEKGVVAKPSTPYSRPVGADEKKLPPNVKARYLYQPGELEGGTKRATDPVWSLKVYTLEKVVDKPGKAPVFRSINTAVERRFKTLLGNFVLFLRHAFRAELFFFRR